MSRRQRPSARSRPPALVAAAGRSSALGRPRSRVAPRLPMKAAARGSRRLVAAARLVDLAEARALARSVLRRGAPAAAAAHPDRRFRARIPHCSSPPSGSSPACSGSREWRIVPHTPERRIRRAVRRPAGQRGAGRASIPGARRRGGQPGARAALRHLRSTSSSTPPTGPAARRDAHAQRTLLYWAAVASRRSSPASISTISFPPPPATDRNSSGWIPASTAARKDCSTRPARWAISARSSW